MIKRILVFVLITLWVYALFPVLTLAQSPTTTLIPGDLNNDGKVDIDDYNLLVASFGHPYTIFDYNQLVANFGKSI